MAPLAAESLNYIVNHLILPPKLPQQAESIDVIRRAEQALLRLVLDRVKAYGSKSSPSFSEQWRTIEKMLTWWITLNLPQKLSSKALAEALSGMRATGEPRLEFMENQLIEATCRCPGVPNQISKCLSRCSQDRRYFHFGMFRSFAK